MFLGWKTPWSSRRSPRPFSKCEFASRMNQEVFEYGFVQGFQVVKVPVFGGFSLGNPTNKATTSKLFQGESLCPSTVRRGSEYG